MNRENEFPSADARKRQLDVAMRHQLFVRLIKTAEKKREKERERERERSSSRDNCLAESMIQAAIPLR